MTALLLAVLVLAVLFDYINGFHDTANAIATSVATRALRPAYAIGMAAAFNFIGAFAGTAVAKTIGGGLVDEQTTTQTVVVAALVGAIIWNLITWRMGIPSSSSHALIGGLMGATIVAAGVGAIKMDGLVSKVLVPLFSSPIIGFVGRLLPDDRPLLDLPARRPAAAGATLPAAAARVRRVHGLQPRLERRPEDDGDHHPRPLLGRRHRQRGRARPG